MAEYRKSVRAETGATDEQLKLNARTVVEGGVPYLVSTAANSQTVDRALEMVLNQIHATHRNASNDSALKPGEEYVYPEVVRHRIGASPEGRLQGGLSIHRVANSLPPAVIVTGWLRGRE